MKRAVQIALTLTILTAAPLAHAQTPKTPVSSPAATSVAGKWTMTLETPHGKMTAIFDLTVEGRKVTGTLASDHSDKVGIAGEFVNGKLTFKVIDGDMSFAGTMKDADTLNGIVSSERGDLTGVAKRVKK